ncbi:MAG: hypothetical protein H7841_04880 [Magnetospirillum sp. WYHS-4]
MFDILFTKIGGVPVFYIVPIMFFGPILIWAMYNIGIGHVVFLPGEIMRKLRREKAERDSLMAERRKKMGDAQRIIKRSERRTPVQLLGQAAFYGLLGLPIAYYSNNPTYHLHAADQAEIKLSLSRPGLHSGACRERTPEELAKLPPQGRIKTVCESRGRSPVTIRVELDGKALYERTVKPSGLSSDGNSVFYAKFLVPAGTHKLVALMRLKQDKADFDHRLEETITLEPKRVVVISHRVEDDRLFLRW